MIKFFILANFSKAIVIVLILFVIVKGIAIISTKLKGNPFTLFFASLGMQSNQSITNTFDEDLKKYLRKSNAINIFFYSIAGLIILVYLLFRAI